MKSTVLRNSASQNGTRVAAEKIGAYLNRWPWLTHRGAAFALLLAGTVLFLVLSGCSKVQADPQAGAPPAARVVLFGDVALFSVEHPEQFPLATATEHPTTSELVVTGSVTPDNVTSPLA